MNCQICNAAPDLFSFVTGDAACAICKVRFIGGLPTTPERIAEVRQTLGLAPGAYLEQDRAAEARQILGRPTGVRR